MKVMSHRHHQCVPDACILAVTRLGIAHGRLSEEPAEFSGFMTGEEAGGLKTGSLAAAAIVSNSSPGKGHRFEPPANACNLNTDHLD